MNHKETRGSHAGPARQNSTIQKFADQRIQEACSEAIFRCQEVDSTEVVITVEDGVAHLSGIVHDEKSRAVTEKCLKDIPELLDIVNELKVIPVDRFKLS